MKVYMFFVDGHLVNERCDAHACLAGVFHCQRRAGVGVVARDVDKPVQDVV